MATFDFRCANCSRDFERTVSGAPDVIKCLFCGESTARRRFTPTKNIVIPAHFALTTAAGTTCDWCLPDREDKEGWEARCNSSQTHAPKQPDLAEHLTEELFGRERITLSRGG